MTNSSKNLVVVSETLPLGGTSTFVMNLCRGMSRRDDWSAIGAGLRGLNEIGTQIRDEGLPMITPDESALLHEERIESLYRQCAAHQARAVAAGLGSGAFDLLRYVPAGCLRIGMIQSDDEGVYDLVERYLPWLDVVAGVSLEICRKMKNRLSDNRVSVIHQPYGVSMPENPAVRSLSAPLKVLYLGRVLEEQKRVRLMTRVIKQTLNEVSDIRWTIAGDGADLEFMKEQFDKEMDRVQFLGNVPYSKIPSILPEHDVYFLCSDFEGLPLSLLESMGAGLVPVVSDLASGISEVVNDTNGIRVAIDDEIGYSDAIVRLANDRELLATMSSRASHAVRKSHSTEAMTQRWVEMLETHLPSQVPVWKSSCKATAPMELDGKWQYSPTMRPVRRIVKRLRML